MADVSRLKRSSLGAPPPLEEASQNLAAPELVSSPVQETQTKVHRRDGRTMRRTNRTLPFATRVSLEFDSRLRDAAERDGLKLVELLERALDAYEELRIRRNS